MSKNSASDADQYWIRLRWPSGSGSVFRFCIQVLSKSAKSDNGAVLFLLLLFFFFCLSAPKIKKKISTGTAWSRPDPYLLDPYSMAFIRMQNLGCFWFFIVQVRSRNTGGYGYGNMLNYALITKYFCCCYIKL